VLHLADRQDRRSAVFCGVGAVMLLGGFVYPGSQAVTATTLIVLGAAQVAVGLLLPRLTEFEIGPAGLKTKIRPAEQAVALSVAGEASRLNRFARLMCGNAEQARELVEEALVRTRRSGVRGRERDAIQLKVLLDLLDTAQERLWLEGRSVPDGVPQGGAGSDASAEEISAALRQLPFAQRAAFLLRVDWSLPVDEVAAVLERPSDDVRKDIEIARRHLRPAIEGREASTGG
jgi:DNA-directed RNA polymerase specialized sigma24 family protein